MNVSLGVLFAVGLGYLLLLFALAHLAERRWIPERILHHPLVYVLSLGVIAGAFGFYGTVGLAYEYGYGFLAYYLGICLSFMFAPLVLSPLHRLCRTYQLSSLADVLTFRFRSQWAGSVVTLFTLLAVLPLLALQIQAVSNTVNVLANDTRDLYSDGPQPDGLALIFCCVITVFTVLFGSRHTSSHERHSGLVAAIAFDSVFKLVALLVLGYVAVFQVFDGFQGLEDWLARHTDIQALLYTPIRQDATRSLLIIFFSAAVCMPQLFHMVFAENPNRRALQTASWGLPLYLLLLALPVLPILWAGFQLDTYLPPEYFTLALGVERESPALALMVFLAGLSAASGAIMVTTLAVASMCLNHLVLPFYQPGTDQDIYRWLLWIRRLLIAAIILGGYVFYRVITGREDLASLGMASAIATLQFLPGVLAVLYWPRANRLGFLAGLVTGYSVWFVALLLPIVSEFSPDALLSVYRDFVRTDTLWSAVTMLSLALNAMVFSLVSLLTRTYPDERAAAEVCSLDDLNRPARGILDIQSPHDIRQRLATVLGEASASHELGRALRDLQLSSDESRPYALRRLRDRIETNLSGLMGPSVAYEIINKVLPYQPGGQITGEDINLIEYRLERAKPLLTGLAADLDSLRRHHRQTLEELPIGVCAMGHDGEILLWNQAMGRLTGITSEQVIGSHLGNLPAHWSALLGDFLASPSPRLHKQEINPGGQRRWVSLHKAHQAGLGNDQVIVVEDITETELLAQELMHSERLASIGRLAAGVAHEIGNPITGIACLAQNLRLDKQDPALLATADDILKQTQRVSRIVQTLINFAHAGQAGQEGAPQPRVPVVVRSCADEAIQLLTLNHEATPVHFDNQCPDHLVASGDPQLLLQVLVNLLSNARDASRAGDPIHIQCHVAGERLHITVTDQGSGIAREHLEAIFEPFFTTKEAGRGTGLGLALAYSIVEDLGGEISLESPVPGHAAGTRAHLWLPRHHSPATA